MDKKLVSKDLVWKGLRMELSGDELRDIMQQECEKDEYYDFDLMLKGFGKALAKEIDFDYYIHWCILIANCLNYSRYSSPKINLTPSASNCSFNSVARASFFRSLATTFAPKDISCLIKG